MAGNERLAALMTEAGFLDRDATVGRKRFARAVTDEAKAVGSKRTYSHTYVTRWINGMVPRDGDTRGFVASALGRKLGRPIALDEIGYSDGATVSSDLGLSYPSRSDDSVAAVAQLLHADLDGAPAVVSSPPNISAWNEASLSWLVGSVVRSPDTGGGPKVGLGDVERVRATRAMFDRLDNQFGGAHARRSLLEYLRDDLPLLLRGSASEVVRQDLFSAAGEATQLAAWMSYDAGLHGVAQRYFIQALGLADAANDRLLAASILDAMSHQATFLGRFREAANLARAARMGTASVSSPILTAHFYVMEARALARVGDAKACDAALSAATTEFERRVPGEGPEWIQYFDDAELAAEFGHCNRDLGRAVHASTYATQSLGTASGEYLRSDFFATMVLADAYMDQGEVDEACRVALSALSIGENVKSARCAAYVVEFRERLAKVSTSVAARDFSERAAGARLWLPREGA